MLTGKIINFFEHKNIISGICLEQKGSRIRVLLEDGKEIKLSTNRIFHACACEVDLKSARKKLLREITKKTALQENLMQQVRAGKLWETLDDKGGLYDFSTLAKIAFGEKAGPDHEAAVIRALMQDRIHFKFQDTKFLATPPRQIEKLKVKMEEELQQQQETAKASAWLQSVFAGKKIIPYKNRDKLIKHLKDFVVFGKEAPHYRNTKQILASVGACEQRACFDMLVKLGIWDEDENLLLQRHGISHTWPDSVTEQMEALGKADLLKTVKDKQRKDLTHLQTFSIDEPFTRDIDDAISFEFHKDFLQLGIHVTDAASLIPPGSPLDKESARRGASLYLPDEKVPMLPQTLSEKMLSLMKGKRRPAISFLVNLSLKGEMLDFKSILSVIRVSEKLSYNEVDVDIEKGGRFLRLYNLVSSLRKRRTESGATWVLIPELQVRLDRKKKVVLTIRDKESPSQVLVSESMILANHCAALLFIEKQFPALYRKQAAPSKKIDPGTRPSLFQLFSQRRKFSRVEVDVTPGPHSSLGLSSYTSITSPLRKHLDLVTQRQLVSLIKDEAPVYNRKELKNIASSVLSMLTKASIVDQERKRYWLLKVLRNRVGEELKALVINFRFGAYNIILLDYLLDVILKVPEGIFISPGDIVSVMIKSVDPFAGTSKVELPG